jgi:hypothetical protein
MLPKLMAKACESRIPRSGQEGEKVNCFVVAIDRDGSPFFVATGYEDQTLTGLKWDGHSYANEHSLGLSVSWKMASSELHITMAHPK